LSLYRIPVYDKIRNSAKKIVLLLAGAAFLHKDGTCEAAHDPRADGGAAGV
jgi:hypothetical protein